MVVDRPPVVGIGPEPILGLASRIGGLVTFGMVLYVPVMLPDVPGLPLLLAVLAVGFKEKLFNSRFLSSFWSSFVGEGVLTFLKLLRAKSSSVCMATGVNSRSYVFGIAPSSAH